MKILIQNRKTRLFLSDTRGWTSKMTQAKNFENALTAFEFAQMNVMEDTEIVFQPTKHLAHQILHPDSPIKAPPAPMSEGGR